MVYKFQIGLLCEFRNKSAQTGSLYTGYLPQSGESVSLAVIQEAGQSELLVVGQDGGHYAKLDQRLEHVHVYCLFVVGL